jgi:hypothetical protein
MTATNLTYVPGRPERNGWIMGLTMPQVVICLVCVMPLVVCFGANRVAQGLMLLPVAAIVVALTVVPIRGRPAAKWLADTALFGTGQTTGWSSWQSKAAAGLPVDPDEPDLPGSLSRLDLLDGPPMPDHGRVCVLHDTAEGRWGATARLSARGVGLASAIECKNLAAGLGNMLKGLSASDRIDRASLVVRSVPDDGTAYDLWRERHQVDDAPDLSVAVADDLRRMAGSVAVRQEAFLTVSARDDVLRRPANAAGGGAFGRAHALHRALGALVEPLQQMGCDAPDWLTSAGIAESIRTGFNPAAAGALTHRRLSHGDPGLPAAAAGPTRAPAPAARSYHHDGFVTVSYAVIPPRSGVRFGSLAPLLAVRSPGERRSLAVHYEVLPQRMAQRIATRERQTTTLVSEIRSSKGFGSAAKDNQDRGSSYRQEDAVAAGEAMVRYALVVSVTVPDDWNIEDHAEALETSAAGQYQLLRLELAQDSGFVAANLPVGIGLARLRNAL